MTESTTNFFLTDFQRGIWHDNYRDIANDPTVEATFNRMARTIFANESEELQQDLFEQQLMAKIFFGGRVYNLGRGLKNVNAFNCYAAQRSTMPVDSISNIFSDITNAAEILKTEGGIGFNFNHIRPKGTLIKGVGVGTPGVLAFMEIQDKTADVITRGSTDDIIQADETTPTKKKIRKGAQISLLDCRHPEIFAYIDAKKIPNRFVWFNMSVIITDRFMERCSENINKIVIELNDGTKHELDPNEEIEIDGVIMTAKEYKDGCENNATKRRIYQDDKTISSSERCS